jgi:hypothetical protein
MPDACIDQNHTQTVPNKKKSENIQRAASNPNIDLGKH